MTNLLKNERVNGYMSFDYERFYYNDFNQKGNDPNCKHEFYTQTISGSRQPAINKYCASCGYRRLFIKYAKYCKK